MVDAFLKTDRLEDLLEGRVVQPLVIQAVEICVDNSLLVTCSVGLINHKLMPAFRMHHQVSALDCTLEPGFQRFVAFLSKVVCEGLNDTWAWVVQKLGMMLHKIERFVSSVNLNRLQHQLVNNSLYLIVLFLLFCLFYFFIRIRITSFPLVFCTFLLQW